MAEQRPWPVFDIPDPFPADGTVLYEQDGWLWIVDRANGWLDTNIRCEVVPGGVADVENTLQFRAVQALNQLESAADNWDSLTAVQKDAAVRLAVRAVCRLVRLVLRRFDATGG